MNPAGGAEKAGRGPRGVPLPRAAQCPRSALAGALPGRLPGGRLARRRLLATSGLAPGRRLPRSLPRGRLPRGRLPRRGLPCGLPGRGFPCRPLPCGRGLLGRSRPLGGRPLPGRSRLLGGSLTRRLPGGGHCSPPLAWSGRHSLQASTFPFAHAPPHSVTLVAPKRVVQTFDPYRTVRTDPLGLARGTALLGEEDLGVEFSAPGPLLPRDVVVHRPPPLRPESHG